MVYNTLLTILAIPLIFSSMLLLGKYISKSQEIFINNKAGSFMTGAVVYLFITFVVLFPFMWTSLGVVYFIIIFMIKEVILYIFLITRGGFKTNWKTIRWLLTILVASIIITVIYNLGISTFLHKSNPHITSANFSSWNKMSQIFSQFFKMGTSYTMNWFMTIIVSGIAFTSVVAFIKELVNWRGFWIEAIGFLLTLVIITMFSFGVSLFHLVGVFIIIFMIILSIRLVDTSRRRYGVLYGLSTIALYSSTDHLLLAVLFLSFVTMTIYTILRKPKSTLFWIQLFTPAAIVGSLTLYSFSAVLAIVIFSIAVISYILILAVSRTRLTKKIDWFFEKTRYIMPSVVIVAFIATSTTLYLLTKSQFSPNSLMPSFVYSTFTAGFVENIVQEVIYYILLFLGLLYVIYMLVKKQKLMGVRIILLFGIIILMVIYNPLTKVIFDSTGAVWSYSLFKTIAFVPLILMIPKAFDKIYKRKHQLT